MKQFEWVQKALDWEEVVVQFDDTLKIGFQLK